MTRARSASPGAPAPELPLPTAGGSYLREADGTLTLIPDGPVPPPTADVTETLPEKEA